MEKYITFDVGGMKVKHALIKKNGEFVTKSEYPTERNSLDIFLKDMLDTINDYRENSEVSGIAISLPGYIDVMTGYSELAGAISALHGQNLKILLEESTGLPVEIENDGNCAALAERVSGNAQGCEHFICMTIGTGVGGGIFLNGDIYRGHSFRAGEYGGMFTVFQNGERKDMHETASMTALIKAYEDYKKIDDQIDGKDIFTEAESDPAIKAILDDWINHISRGIYNLATTFNPEKILIGGGVSTQSYLFEKINRQLEEYGLWSYFKMPVEPCKFRNDAGMLGAFYHFINIHAGDPAIRRS